MRNPASSLPPALVALATLSPVGASGGDESGEGETCARGGNGVDGDGVGRAGRGCWGVGVFEGWCKDGDAGGSGTGGDNMGEGDGAKGEGGVTC